MLSGTNKRGGDLDLSRSKLASLILDKHLCRKDLRRQLKKNTKHDKMFDQNHLMDRQKFLKIK